MSAPTMVLLLRASGWAALVLLTLTLAATPVARRWPAAARRRRPLGIASAALASAHALASWTFYLGDDALAALAQIPWLRAGALALLLLAPLWLTSYPALVARVRLRAWKVLHRAAYAALVFALLHALRAPGAATAPLLALAMLAFALLLVRLVPRRLRDDRTVNDP